LPGLCLYGERWLQNEVFPHFRDLAQQRASLKDYFADEQVQAYLEELPSEPDTAQWDAAPTPIGSTTGSTTAPFARRATAPQSRYTQAETVSNGFGMGGTATLEPAAAAYAATNGTSAVPTAERVSQMSPSGRLTAGSGRSPRSSLSDSSRRTSTSLSGNSGGSGITLRLDRLMLLLALGVLSLGLLWLLLSWVARSFNSGPVLEGEQLSISLAEPVVPIPEETEQSPAPADPSAPLTAESGKALVETWLRAKSAAMGSSYDTSQLAQILADPMLSQWRSNSEAARLEGSSLTYTHEVRQVNVLPPTASSSTDEAQIDAVVVENGETLNVRYYLTRQGGQWRIRSNEILPDGPLESITTSGSTDPAASDPAALPITSPGLQPAPAPTPALPQSPGASPLPEGSLPAPGSAVPNAPNAAPAGNGASGRIDPADASN
jgi:hypothetical protein